MTRLLPLAALLAALPAHAGGLFSSPDGPGLFSRADPRVGAANDAYAKGKYDDALRGYEQAELDAPNSPVLDFDRGNALYKLGRRDEARSAYQSALAAQDSALEAKDYYNLGNALWDLGEKDRAAEAYQRALLLDPANDDARHNLELLLAPPPDQDGGTPDGGPPDGGQEDGGSPQNQKPDGGQGGGADGGGSDGGASDGGGGKQNDQGGGDGGPSDGGSADGGTEPPPEAQDGGRDGGASEEKPLAERDGGAAGRNQAEAQAQPLDQQRAEQLLDALRQREKNLQLWKFRLKHQRAKDVDKDW